MKLRNKLILSCAALAAVATTAFSTTFAWYTSNTEVKATGITGKTKTGADTTLLISKTGAQKSWGASVDLQFTVSELGSLIPVAYNSTGDSYAAWDKTENAPSDTAIDASSIASTGKFTGEYLSFMLYFKSGSSDSINVGLQAFNLKNTTTTLPGKTTLTNVGLAGVSTPTYTANILRSLTVATNAGASTEVASGFANQSSAATRKAYNVEAFMNGATDSLSAATSFSAHEYYDAIKGTNITADAAALTTPNQSETLTALSASDYTTGTLASLISLGTTGEGATGALDPILAVRFDIYLDGWDKACFDACQGQTFTLAMEFGVITA